MSLAIIIGLVAGTVSNQEADALLPGNNTLVSYDDAGTGPVGGSFASLSDDGYQAFYIRGGTLIKRDLRAGTNSTVVSSVSSYNNFNYYSVSKTGRYVLFTSYATNLIDGYTSDGKLHAYLRDTVAGVTTLVDKTSTGVVGNDQAFAGNVSDDGRFVVFGSTATNLGGGGSGLAYLYMRDMINGTMQVLSRSAGGINANNSIGRPSASCDGSIVVFSSSATNLTPSNNGHTSTYMVDLRNGFSITNLTLAANGDTYPNGISCDGRYISLQSMATNLTSESVSPGHVFRYDRISGEYTIIDRSSVGSTPVGGTAPPYAGRVISDSGSALFKTSNVNVVSPAATNFYEVYLRTPENNTTELVAVNSSGQEGSPAYTYVSHSMAIAANGKKIIYTSKATNLIPGVTTVGSGEDGNVVLSMVQ